MRSWLDADPSRASVETDASAEPPNKRTLDVIERLAALRCDPITGMARIALNMKNPVELRAKMFAELAQYVAPKRKAVEHAAEPGLIETLLARIDA